MEQYYLNTLIVFFKSQQAIRYQAIEQVLAIIDDDGLTDAEKRQRLIYILRRFGLNEIGYMEGRFKPAFEILHEEIPDEGKEPYFITQPVTMHLLNCTIETYEALN